MELKKGKKYFIRTVTHYFTGKLRAVTKDALVLVEAAWIADTGRFADFLRTGNANEVEPYPAKSHVFVSRGAVVDVSEWGHSLPKDQK